MSVIGWIGMRMCIYCGWMWGVSGDCCIVLICRCRKLWIILLVIGMFVCIWCCFFLVSCVWY